uniref:Uncharacterized protein n=1 Tax=Arundo donax TaxID=35708 RepID=A0A0A8XYV2_ARUDO
MNWSSGQTCSSSSERRTGQVDRPAALAAKDCMVLDGMVSRCYPNELVGSVFGSDGPSITWRRKPNGLYMDSLLKPKVQHIYSETCAEYVGTMFL